MSQRSVEIAKKQYAEVRRARGESLLKELSDLGVTAQIIYDDSHLDAWIERHFPFTQWGRIDWSRVPGSICIPEASVDNPASWLKELASEQGLPNVEVLVVRADALDPSLRIQLMDALEHEETVLASYGWDTWLFDENDNWILEHYHEGEYCWGRAI